MSTEPVPGPDPYDDDPPRPRWLAPALIGLAIGVLVGGAAVFIVSSLAGRTRDSELAAEKFNIQNVLANTPGTDNISPGSNSTDYLGAMGRRTNSGSAVHRRITLSGTIPAGANPGTLGNTLKAQIDAELIRYGGYSTGGGSSSSSGPDEYSEEWESDYYTRDGRRGCIDGKITISRGNLRALIIITEGR